mgnify:CR=1 FL=1
MEIEEWLEKDYPIIWHEAYDIGVNAKKSGLSRMCNLSEYDKKFCHNGNALKVWQSAWEQGYDNENNN